MSQKRFETSELKLDERAIDEVINGEQAEADRQRFMVAQAANLAANQRDVYAADEAARAKEIARRPRTLPIEATPIAEEPRPAGPTDAQTSAPPRDRVSRWGMIVFVSVGALALLITVLLVRPWSAPSGRPGSTSEPVSSPSATPVTTGAPVIPIESSAPAVSAIAAQPSSAPSTAASPSATAGPSTSAKARPPSTSTGYEPIFDFPKEERKPR